MSDTLNDTLADDAPLKTTKQSGAADSAIGSLVEDRGATLVGRSVTINRPRSELYAYFRDFRNLPAFMDNVEQVVVHDATRAIAEADRAERVQALLETLVE